MGESYSVIVEKLEDDLQLKDSELVDLKLAFRCFFFFFLNNSVCMSHSLDLNTVYLGSIILSLLTFPVLVGIHLSH